MIVMNKEGEMFDERRKGDRRLCKRRDQDINNSNTDAKEDRRKESRRKKDINKK